MEILIGIIVVILYLIGGQITKATRRYGVPVTLYGLTWIAGDQDKSKAQRIKEIVLLSMVALLSQGYGENSRLRSIFKYDWLTRIFYGLMLSIPLLIIKMVWFIPIILAGAYMVRAGSLFRFSVKGRQFDILIEDIVRSVCLFICTYLVLI